MTMPFVLTKARIIILGSLALVVVFIILLLAGVIPGLRRNSTPSASVSLTVWGVYDDRRVFDDTATRYRSSRSNVEITYRQFDPNTYETELINALAAGTGPDIFMFQNTWLPKHMDKIVPAPDDPVTKKPLIATFSDPDMGFPQVVLQDFAPGGVVYASPLYVDTLAMFYNKDTFDKFGIALPPKNWTEFQEIAKKLREIDTKTNQISKAGAAIGGSNKSINRATDLLSLIMLQSGTQMAPPTDFSRATFAQGASGDKQPGLDSLNFYTQFANPASPLYTWNDNLHYSVDNFAEGNTAILFNYSHQISILRAKNPFLNFGVIGVPQIDGSPQPVAYANYWGLAVSNKSKVPGWAWDFIKYATMDSGAADKYFIATKKPPALRALINKYINDSDISLFAKQALIARTWPQIDNNKVEQIFSDMIEAVISGRLSSNDALQKAEDEVTLLMRRGI